MSIIIQAELTVEHWEALDRHVQSMSTNRAELKSHALVTAQQKGLLPPGVSI